MKKTLWLGLMTCLACSSSGGAGGDSAGGDSAGGDSAGDANDDAMMPERPGAGEAPTLEDVTGDGPDVDLETIEFPEIFGAGFAGTAFPSSTCTADCEDFPADPILEPGVAPGVVDQFGAPDEFGAGNLCVLEPQLSAGDLPGALFPANWLRPRFRWAGGGQGASFEIRLQNEIEVSDLVVYTNGNEWTMPQDIWRSVALNVHTPITVTIRALSGGNVTGTRGSFQIAPVNAGGSMVFWATSTSVVTASSSQLLGFSVGEEGVIQTLAVGDVEQGGLVGEDGEQARGNYNGDLAANGIPNGTVACVGCHISTPDGESVVFTDAWPWNKLVSSITEDTTGSLPDYMTDGAALVLSQPWLGTQTMSPAHFSAGDRIVVTSYGIQAAGDPTPREPWDARFAQGAGPPRHALAWFDLEAQVTVADRSEIGEFAQNNDYTDSFDYPTEPADLQFVPPQPPAQGQLDRRMLSLFREQTVANARGTAFDVMATTGDNRSAVTPDWSHDGTQIAYVATDVTSSDGHPDWTANQADVRVVPYNDGAGGPSAALQGASSPNFLEYYPAFSSNDELIAFARAPQPSNPTRQPCNETTAGTCRQQQLGENPDGPYYNRNGEIYVVPREGGTPIRLAANDPPACTGETSRGIINSWPKWSPRVVSTGGKTYYFLVFSSARDYPGRFDVPIDPRFTQPILPTSSQLYVTAVVVDDETGEVETRPALYLWNQNRIVNANGNVREEQLSNLTPAWDEFILPPVVIQ